MNIAHQIISWLQSQEFQQVFTVCGGASQFLNDAVNNVRGLKVTYLHHEQACAMAAEAYARILNRPALLITTSGPGSINALNGVFGAYTDSIPILVLSGQIKKATCTYFQKDKRIRQLGDQEAPVFDIVKPITKYSCIIKSAGELNKKLPLSIEKLRTGRQGPVWLDIPIDIQSSNYQLNPLMVNRRVFPITKSLKRNCKTVLTRLLNAKKPLILAGSGIRQADLVGSLKKFSVNYKIPVATAWTHDIFDNKSKLYASRPGTIGTRAGNIILDKCDFLLILGSRLNIRQIGYNFTGFAPNAWKAHVDVDRHELEKTTISCDLKIRADLRNFFHVFDTLTVRKNESNRPLWLKEIADTKKKYCQSKEPYVYSTKFINPYRFIKDLFQLLRPKDIVVCGNASACIIPYQIGILGPQNRMISNSGSASMGWDLPAGIGASISAGRRRRVLCIAGDGSIQMNIQELQTIVHHNLNLVIIVLNNNGYMSIRNSQERHFGQTFGADKASGISFPNLTRVAKAYRIPAYTVNYKTPEQRLNELLTRNGPLLLDVHVNPNQGFTPFVKAYRTKSGKLVSPRLSEMHPPLAI